jgi:uncharacterized pyridoxal phosphate-containing UPF0001 family protein
MEDTMTETECNTQAIDELHERVQKLETQVEFLTKHITLMGGVQRNEFKSLDRLFDKIHSMEGRRV